MPVKKTEKGETNGSDVYNKNQEKMQIEEVGWGQWQQMFKRCQAEAGLNVGH